MNIKGLLEATLLTFMSASSYAGLITIDEFNDDQATIIAHIGETVGTSVLGTQIIGGERDLTITNHSATNDRTASVRVSNGELSLESGAFVIASLAIQWDGLDGSADLDVDGLMDTSTMKGMDLTGGDTQRSFLTETLFADFTYFFDVELWWNKGTESEKLTLLGPGHRDPVTAYEAFLPFVGFTSADLTDVTAIEVTVNTLSPAGVTDDFGDLIPEGQRVSAFDISIGSINSVEVPEPASVALFGMALLGFAGASRMRKS